MRKANIDCLGIPVYYDEDAPHLSCAKGFLFWKWIVVNRHFSAFSDREKTAVLLHEVAHCKLWHVEKRTLKGWLVLFDRKKLMRLCQEQEMQADRFSAELGYAMDLASVLSRVREGRGPFHPEVRLRVEALMNYRGVSLG